jgi:hypothetical protein
MRIEQMTKPNPLRKTHNDTNGDWLLPDKATARARRIHAATSLTAAADIAILPTLVVRSFNSAKIRANTGNAVIDSATPIYTRNAEVFTPLAIVACSTNDEPIPSANGKLIPAIAIARTRPPVFRRDLGSNSMPAKNRKNIRPRFARVSNTVRLLGGKTACR